MQKLFRYLYIACFFLLLFLGGCHKEDIVKKEPEEVIIEEGPEEESDDINLDDVYQEVLGKWSIYRQCGGVVGCVDVENFYHEYTPKG